MPVNQELKSIISEIKFKNKLTQAQISDSIGVKSTYLSDVINGRVPVSDSILNKIYEVYSYTKPETSENIEIEELEVEEIEKLPIKKIPFFDVDFYSGFTKIFNNQTISPSYYFYLPEFHNAQFAIKNSGKSMSKELGNDDILGLREVPEWQNYFPQGEIYAVVTTNDLRTIKKVRRDKNNKNLVLIPKPLDEDKFDYPDYEEVPISMVTALFQVVASTHSKKLAL